MKKVIALVVFIFALTASSFAQFKFGAGANMIFSGSSLGVGARAHYTINEDFAAQGSFHYYFEDSDLSLSSIDLDVHYNGFGLGDVESFSLTPFAGLNISRASAFGISASSTNINVGVNGTMPLGGLELYLEPKFIIGNGGTLALAAGVYF